MKRLFILSVILLMATCFAQQIPPIKNKQPLSIGEFISFYSSVLQEDRILNIYLPLGYSADSPQTYPVIYLLDGSMDEDFMHIAGLVQFASFSWINMMEPCIVVGIANVDRRRDFTYPTNIAKDKVDYPTTGGSKNFIQCIENEIQPLISSNYKTNGTKTIIGQSLGALLATEILLKKPELFTNYLIVSPSLWWDNESLLKVEQATNSVPSSIYVAVGNEGAIMKSGARKLFNKLKKLNTKDTRVYFQYFAQLNHGDALHLAAYNGFKKMFR